MEYLDTLALALKNPATDILVVGFFLLFGFVLGMQGGRVRLFAFLIATYMALFLSRPVFGILDANKVDMGIYRNIFIYFALLGLLYLFVDRVLFAHSGRGLLAWWQALILSFCIVGFFVSGTLNIVSFKGILQLSPFTVSFFVGKNAYLFWSFAPILGAALFGRRK